MSKRKKQKRRKMRITPAPRGVEVAPTPVGLGLFARWDYEEEERIGEIGGEVILDPNYSSDYCIELTHESALEPDEPYRFLNHSCDPNCELAWEEIEGETHIFLETLRPIGFGEQLTIDYAWPLEDAIPCQCQSAWCRGWVVDEEELPELLDKLAAAEEVETQTVEVAPAAELTEADTVAL